MILSLVYNLFILHEIYICRLIKEAYLKMVLRYIIVIDVLDIWIRVKAIYYNEPYYICNVCIALTFPFRAHIMYIIDFIIIIN